MNGLHTIRLQTLRGILMTAFHELAAIEDAQDLTGYRERHERLMSCADYLCSECWGWGQGVLQPEEEIQLDLAMHALQALGLTVEARATNAGLPASDCQPATPLRAASAGYR